MAWGVRTSAGISKTLAARMMGMIMLIFMSSLRT
jgi:hypothetical protein